MKKLLFAVTALAALSLLAPSTGFAQGANNQLGFYIDEEMSATDVVADPFVNQVIYLVLSNPYGEAGETPGPLNDIGGAEFSVLIDGNGMDMGFVWGSFSGVIDVGVGTDHIGGFGAPWPVTDGTLTLGTQTVFPMDTEPIYVSLAVTDPASIAGNMSILFGGASLQAIYPSSGDFANPVFALNGTVVATESVRMDEIKALYR